MTATSAEVMIAAMAHLLRDGEVAITGAFSAMPMLACRLAQLTHAPNLTLIAGGSGAVNPSLDPVPASSCDERLLDADAVLDLGQVIDVEAYTRIDVFFAGGLQIDALGRCNLAGVRSEGKWKLRGPGSVGLPFLSRARRVILYTTSHSRRTFVPAVDFVSGNAAKEGGTPAVTPLAVISVGEKPRLVSAHPGVRAEEVVAETGFPLEVPDPVPQTPLPTEAELAVLRRLDPEGVARSLPAR
ncbi:MAG TPA: CoA-transferase [Thermoplasmata archaeon]|nr:CoA-transferase [Thermoplasmata archaeon]